MAQARSLRHRRRRLGRSGRTLSLPPASLLEIDTVCCFSIQNNIFTRPIIYRETWDFFPN